MSSNSNNTSTISQFILTLLLSLGIIISYMWQLAEQNAYMGYRPLIIDFPYIATILLSCLATAKIMPKKIAVPSDYFCLTYSIFVLIPYFTLYEIRGNIDTEVFLLNITILSLPLVTIRIINAHSIKIKGFDILSTKALLFAGGVVVTVGVFYALVKGGGNGGFDLDTSYVRRLEGRESFSSGSITAYANGMILNGLAPYLAFVAAFRGKKIFTVISLFTVLAFFYLLGTKAPIISVGLAHLLGIAAKNDRLKNTQEILYSILFLLFIGSFLELLLVGNSVIGDYFIRRSFTVPPLLLSTYFELMGNTTGTLWTPLGGVSNVTQITYFIGDFFFGDKGMNANTNAFIYELAANGYIRFIFTIALVVFVFFLLNGSYRKTRNPATLYVGFLYSTLIAEQSATTALLTSGIGLLLIITMSTKDSSSNCISHDKNN